MATIVISGNVSVDGVMQDDGFRHSGWLYIDNRDDWAKVEFAEAQRAEALLLGRRTDEYFASRALIEYDLVDELRLIVFPVILGDGRRLIDQTSDKKSLRLLSSTTIGRNLSYLTYTVDPGA